MDSNVCSDYFFQFRFRFLKLSFPPTLPYAGPSAFWSGWYDLFLRGNLDMFQGYNDYGDESVRHTSQLVSSDCFHKCNLISIVTRYNRYTVFQDNPQ